MKIKLIQNARIILGDRVLPKGWVILSDRRIAEVGVGELPNHHEASEVVDANNKYLAPGFIDLHIHGSGNYIVDDGAESVEKLSTFLVRFGVTAFLPTFIPPGKGRDVEKAKSLSMAISKGAEILGFFFEGPYLSLPGAACHLAEKADLDHVRQLIDAAKPHPVIFAIAPDFPEITKLLPTMTESGKPAFMTHTQGTVKETMAAIEAGARHATHFYNVFYAPETEQRMERRLGKRTCGAVEAILADPRVSVDFILDGEHVDPIAVQMALECKGPEKVCLITDATATAGLPPGRYPSFGHYIEFAYPGAPARFIKEHPTLPGGLAGSNLTMDHALRNAVKMLNLSLPTAVELLTVSPAKVLKIDHRKGKIAEGYDADLVLLNDDLEPVATWVAGEKIYDARDRHPQGAL